MDAVAIVAAEEEAEGRRDEGEAQKHPAQGKKHGDHEFVTYEARSFGRRNHSTIFNSVHQTLSTRAPFNHNVVWLGRLRSVLWIPGDATAFGCELVSPLLCMLDTASAHSLF